MLDICTGRGEIERRDANLDAWNVTATRSSTDGMVFGMKFELPSRRSAMHSVLGSSSVTFCFCHPDPAPDFGRVRYIEEGSQGGQDATPCVFPFSYLLTVGKSTLKPRRFTVNTHGWLLSARVLSESMSVTDPTSRMRLSSRLCVLCEFLLQHVRLLEHAWMRHSVRHCAQCQVVVLSGSD